MAVAVLLALCVVSVLAAGPESADAARAKTLGKTKRTPRPDCPEKMKGGRLVQDCQAVGHMTGFQASATGGKKLFQAPRSGTLVGWSVALSRPRPAEQRFFEKTFKVKELGDNPTAAIAVLRETKGNEYRLQGQSPVLDLSEHLGSTPVFTLGRPLKIKKGDVLGLSIPTWLPNFATGLPSKNSWRASRAANRCDVNVQTEEGKRNFKKSAPQTKQGSTRAYGCTYRDTRLLYWGYYVPGS